MGSSLHGKIHWMSSLYSHLEKFCSCITYVMVKKDESTGTPVNTGVLGIFGGPERVRFIWMYQAVFEGLPGIGPGKAGF